MASKNTKGTIIVGIDPGFTGAIAKLDPVAHTLEVVMMPTFQIKPGAKTKTVTDHVGLGHILDDDRILHLYLEEVSSRPGMSSVAAWSFSQNYGTVIGCCGALQIPMTLVRPQKWKSDLKVPADKNAARYRASQYFPKCATAWKLAKQDGIAESSLIALYGFCVLGYKIEKPFTLIGELANA